MIEVRVKTLFPKYEKIAPNIKLIDFERVKFLVIFIRTI